MTKLDTCAKRLKYAMELRGLGITELARRTGKSPAATWNWVKEGSTRLPNVESRRLLANALNCTVDWLIYGRGQPPVAGSEMPTTSGANAVKEATDALRIVVAESLGRDPASVLIGIEIKPETPNAAAA